MLARSSGTTTGNYTYTYAPLGGLRTVERDPGNSATYMQETHTPDALGSDSSVVINNAHLNGADEPVRSWRRHYDDGRGNFAGANVFVYDPKWYSWQPDMTQDLDNGKVVHERNHAYAERVNGPYCDTGTLGLDCMMPVDDVTDRYSSYDANDHLRFTVANTRRTYYNGDTVTAVTTEVHYDALGRRVFMRYRGPNPCLQNTPLCRPTTDYQYWAGNQLLGESRTVDNAYAAAPTSTGYDGDVVYTHAGGLDEPLSLYRHSSTCQFTVFPVTDFQGRLASGVSAGTPPSCARVDWPGAERSPYRNLPHNDDTAPWNGSLANLGGDQTGLQYMRNRYYNPASGQFTQADPIGIAGGLNTYGFTGGDPVNYQDPSGLCPAVLALADGPEPGPADAVAAAVCIYEAWTGVRVLDQWFASVSSASSSRAARRAAMRAQGIPTSRPPDKQRCDDKGNRQYEYRAQADATKVVTHHAADDKHPQPHWEAGTAKPEQQYGTSRNGNTRYFNNDPKTGEPKSKCNYDPNSP